MTDTPQRGKVAPDELELDPAMVVPVAAPLEGANVWHNREGTPALMFAVSIPAHYPQPTPHVLKPVGVHCLVLIVRETHKDADTAALLKVLADQTKRTVYYNRETRDTAGVWELDEGDPDPCPVMTVAIAQTKGGTPDAKE